jgi:hypothetical protein
MREYVRVPISFPTGVLLCAYKLWFGLVQNYIEKFKIPSVWAHRTVRCAPDTALCNVWYTGWARADPLLHSVVRWFIEQLLCVVRCASDKHCRLSGVPITGFFKKIFLARAALRLFFPTRGPLSVCALWCLAISPSTASPPASSSCSGEVLLLLLGLHISHLVSSPTAFPPLCFSV